MAKPSDLDPSRDYDLESKDARPARPDEQIIVVQANHGGIQHLTVEYGKYQVGDKYMPGVSIYDQTVIEVRPERFPVVPYTPMLDMEEDFWNE